MVSLIGKRSIVRQGAFLLALLLLWQAAGTSTTTAYYVSSPTSVLAKLWDWISDGEIFVHLVSTASATLGGFAIAVVAGLAAALVFASQPTLGRVFEPFFFAAFSTPKVVIAPLLILWVGVGQLPVISLAAVSSFFIVFYGAYGALRDTPTIFVDTAAVFGAGALRTALQFRLPAAAPFILAGLQQGLVYAFHGAILGEMTASDTGLGYLVIYSATAQDASAVLASLAIIGLISTALVHALNRATRALSTSIPAEAIA